MSEQKFWKILVCNRKKRKKKQHCMFRTALPEILKSDTRGSKAIRSMHCTSQFLNLGYLLWWGHLRISYTLFHHQNIPLIVFSEMWDALPQQTQRYSFIANALHLVFTQSSRSVLKLRAKLQDVKCWPREKTDVSFGCEHLTPHRSVLKIIGAAQEHGMKGRCKKTEATTKWCH